MNFFDSTLIDPIFDVESIGDDPRVPRAHLEVVFATSHHNKRPTPVSCIPIRRARDPYHGYVATHMRKSGDDAL